MKLPKRFHVFNEAATAKPSSGAPEPWFSVKNEAESTEILIYGHIGQGWFEEDGIAAKDFDKELKAVPMGRPITVRINSRGGNVWDGFAIYQMLKRRRDSVTCVVDGLAASIASVVAMAGKECVMPKGSLLMMHEAQGIAIGNAAQLRKDADKLDKHTDEIAAVYAEKSGKSREYFREKMRAETWMNSDDAQNCGLCDRVTNEVPAQNNFDLSCFRRVPEALTKRQTEKPAESKPTNSAQTGSGANDSETMKREEIIALLKEQGIEVQNAATDEQLKEMLKTALAAKKQEPENKDKGQQPAPATEKDAATILALQNAVTALTNQAKESRKASIGAELDKLVENNQIPANERDGWLETCVADESGKVLNRLKAQPAVMPGAEPVAANIEIKVESEHDLVKALKQFNEPGNAYCRGNSFNPVAIANNAVARARFCEKHRDRIAQVFNANSFDATLQRQVVLQASIRALAKVLAPLRGFATSFRNVPLQGTAKVDVPYYPLATAASTDFVQADGYVMGDTTINAREITVNKRKYQPIRFNSDELRRQPFIDLVRIFQIKAEKLAFDVFQNILSVVTNANYGAAAKVEAAATFDLDDVADIRESCNTKQWPQEGRVLLLDSAYDGNLFKQDGLQRANEYGGTEVIRGGLVTRLMGFEYHQSPNIPANAESLKGFAAFMSAILVAISPIEPAAEVRNQLTSYQVFTDPDTNVSFENRVWGNPDSDERREVIEANYGFTKGEADAIRRITSA